MGLPCIRELNVRLKVECGKIKMKFVIEFLPLALSLLALFALLNAKSLIKNSHKPKGAVEKTYLKKEFDEAISRNDKPAAMRAYRHLKGCGLQEAKNHVDSLLSNKSND